MNVPSRAIRIFVGLAAGAMFLVLVFLLWESPQNAQDRESPGVLAPRFAVEDSVKRAIRDKSKLIFRVETATAAERDAAMKMGTVLSDHGGFVIVASSAKASDLEPGVTELETTINLPGKSFDPLKTPGIAKIDLAASVTTAGKGYYIVQFGTTPTDELLDSLRATGVEVLQYVPHQAFIVYGSSESVDLAAGHNRVRWVGRYAPEFKVSAVLTEQIDGFRNRRSLRRGVSKLERTLRDSAIFDVAVFERADVKQAASRVISATGGRLVNAINLPNNFFNVLRVELPIDSVGAVAEIPEVFSIESWSRPRKEDEIAAHIVAGNYVGNVVAPPGYNPFNQFGVDGQGVTVSVVDDGVGIPGDGGFYVTAGNTVNGPLRGATAGAQGHGHLQASIIAGDLPFGGLDANGYNYGGGIAPKANIVNIPFLRGGYTGTEADIFNDTITSFGPNGVLGYISNNSWGSGTNGNSYDAYAAQFDGFVRDASAAATIDPVVIIFSAGNSGTSGLTRPKVAKNLIAVAATENLRPTLPSSGGSTGAADNLEQVPDFSSRGPASDTRVKPDIAAPGDAVTGGRSGPDALFGNVDANHRVSSGTSHAAPQVAGAAALFTQFWKNTNAGNNPSPAMVKAALINGAVEVTGAGAAASRPNNSEGWGRINLKNVLNTGAAITYIDQTAPLTNVGAARNYAGSVADPGRPVRVSLVWTDPPGAGNPALVNDLDLFVTVGGNTYRGNVFSGGSSVFGGASDNRNNVENIFLPAGVSGPITVSVRATAINGDGMLGNADLTDQHFALVVFNGSVSPATSAQPFSEAANVITGNAIIEPSECNLLNIPVTNAGDATATAVSATLSTTTPGVSVTVPTANYPDIAPGATQINSSSFQISTDNTVACLSSVNLTLTVSYSGGASPAVFNYTLQVGTASSGNYNFTSSGGATITPTGTLVAGSAEDDSVVDFAAPFAFAVYGTNVAAGSNIRLATNGYVRIETAGSASAAVTNAALPTTASSSLPTLFPYWDDLDMRPMTTTGGGIFAEVTGSAPNRTLKIEWRARHYITGQALGAPDTNFAVYFHENSDQFEYVYAQTGAGSFASGVSATVGVQAATTGSTFTQYSFNTASLTAGQQLNAARTPGTCSPGAGPCIFTAAPVEVSGRVVSADGRGVRNARVVLTGESGATRTAATNSFGYFRFTGVEIGDSYALSVTARGMSFPSRLLRITENVSDLTIAADY